MQAHDAWLTFADAPRDLEGAPSGWAHSSDSAAHGACEDPLLPTPALQPTGRWLMHARL